MRDEPKLAGPARSLGRRAGRTAVVAVVLALAAASVSAQDAGTFPEDRLSQTIRERMSRDAVPGLVIVLLRDGSPVWTEAFGMADLQAGRAMTPDALFRVESISKPVTAWGTMRLAEAGRLGLDAPVQRCLADWHPRGDLPPITPRQLLSHTAGIGLGDYAERYAPADPRPGLADHLAADVTMVGTPGAGFAYSDTGFNLLELVIEHCTGEDFAVLMDHEILTPLGMDGASYDWTGREMPVGHDLHGQPVAAYVYPGRASGGLHATAADVASFTAAGMAGADQVVLPADGVATLHRPVVEIGGLFGFAADGYALGHFTETLSDGRAAVWHGGQGYGWMSHMHIVPETGDGIVMLSNSQRAWPLFAVILKDWSESLGVAPVGMSRVLWAETTARAGVVLGLFTAVFGLWRAQRGRPRSRGSRIVAGGIAAALLAWPLWAAAQDYLFLFSILPALWPWLASASGLAGAGLAALALLPERLR